MIVGVDEAGVGCLAGPMIIAASAFEDDTHFPEEIRDSKRMTDTQREDAIDVVYDLAEWIVIKIVPASFINRCKHIWDAWETAMRELLEDCVARGPDLIIVDGNREISGIDGITYEVKADDRFSQVSASSIVAKYMQTMHMFDLNEIHPKFRFDHHKGYSTAYHLRILNQFGPTKQHRLKYGPVREAMCELPGKVKMELLQLNLSDGITTTYIGSAKT